MYLFCYIFVIFSATEIYAGDIVNIVSSQIKAEQAMVSAFLDKLTAMYATNNRAVLRMQYPLGNPSSQNPAYWLKNVPNQYLQNIYASTTNQQLQVIVQYNNDAYTTPLLQNAQIVLTAYSNNQPVSFDKALVSNAVKITSWRCSTKSKHLIINQGPFSSCPLQYNNSANFLLY